jgi:hypothetical protein
MRHDAFGFDHGQGLCVSDIAPLAMCLASDESAWITGEFIRAAGGLVVAT